ncbi:MAG: exodeoxyribonuclease VII large subunit [Alistipes sp.]|nr:exodeoxyribonuclease VII large subunit [Alistipes sp.]
MNNSIFEIASTPDASLTLFDLQRIVRATLEERFSAPVWISAEISEVKLNRSGHCYLNLVEKGATDGAPRAEARAVIWRSAYNNIASRFMAATDSELRSGIRILVRVIVTYHEVYGFSLQIIDLDPSYTLGEVERRRRETIERLHADGVWDMNRETEVARPLLRIAVVSSATAAGYRDFIQEVGRSTYPLSITLFEATMQGDSAEKSIIAALERVAEQEQQFDIVALLRGGGSTSDLALFDSYAIASHIAQFPLPVFTGIGHDKDVSVSDMVAHTMCKTPTAVATEIIGYLDEEAWLLDSYAEQLRDITKGIISEQRIVIERSTSELTRSAIVMLNAMSHRLSMAGTALAEGCRTRLGMEHERLSSAEAVVGSHSPEQLLKLGFATLHGSRGMVRSVKDVTSGDSLTVELCDGQIRVVVE